MSIVSKVQNRIGESKKKKYLKKDLKKNQTEEILGFSKFLN